MSLQNQQEKMNQNTMIMYNNKIIHKIKKIITHKV